MATKFFSRYTNAAKRVIFFARIEANHRNEDGISDRDIVLGLLREGVSTSPQLQDFAVELRGKFGLPHLPCTAFPYLRDRDIALRPDAIGAIRNASKEADHDGEYWVDCDHLLRAASSFPGTARQALESTGFTLEGLRIASRSYRRKHESDSVPIGRRISWLISRHQLLVNMIVILAVLLGIVLMLKVRGPL